LSGANVKLEGWDDALMIAEWKLRRGPTTIMALRRVGIIRSIMLTIGIITADNCSSTSV